MKGIDRRKFLFTVAVGIAALASPAWVMAAPKVEADPRNNYTITPEAGPWVIMCGCYNGEYSAELGHEVVLWLRAKQNLAAFVFDKGRQEREQQEKEIEEQKRADPHARIRRIRIEEQCVVLIGGFKDQESATEMLRKKVRQLPPPEIKCNPNVLPGDVATVMEKDGPKAYLINPFAKAMVVPNPTVPQQRSAQKVDPGLKELNEGEPFSLLKNKAPWTVLVREFRGDSAFQIDGADRGDFMDKLPFAPHQRDSKLNSLELAALKAEAAAKWLKESENFEPHIHYEPYVLHTRQSSLLTVGAFDGPNDPRIKDLVEKLYTDARFKPLQLTQPMALEVPRP
jgi:hypothetical protein